MGIVKELGFHGFSISKGKALRTKLLQATLSGSAFGLMQVSVRNHVKIIVSDTLASWMV